MTGSQLLFKLAATHVASHSGWVHALVRNWPLVAGLAASALGMLCWLRALQDFSLPVAYPWTALIYVLVPLASALWFGEVLGMRYLAGMALVVAGVCLCAGGSRR